MALYKIFLNSVIVALITFVICLVLQPVITFNNPVFNTATEKKETNRQAQYQSATTKDDCRLCRENPNDVLQFYFGESNVAVLDLNTFDFLRLEINRYDDEYNLIEEKSETINIIGMKTQSGESIRFTINSDRGYSDGTVTLKENSRLSLDSLSTHLCSGCLTDLMNEYIYKEDYCNIALINFETKKIRPLEEFVAGFSFDDFYVKSKFEKADRKIDLLIWYSPIRYSVLYNGKV